QYALTQKIGIGLAGFRKLDDPVGDCLRQSISLRKSKGYASHFECDAHDARHLGVEPMTVQERSDWHGIGLFFQPTPLPICLRSLLDEKRTSRTGVPGQEKWS